MYVSVGIDEEYMWMFDFEIGEVVIFFLVLLESGLEEDVVVVDFVGVGDVDVGEVLGVDEGEVLFGKMVFDVSWMFGVVGDVVGVEEYGVGCEVEFDVLF